MQTMGNIGIQIDEWSPMQWIQINKSKGHD